MGTVYRDLKDRREVLLIYTQRWIPGRPFELVQSLGGLTLAAVLREYGFNARSFTGITTDVVRLIRERADSLFAVCFYCDFDNLGAIRSILKTLQGESFYKLVGGPQTLHLAPGQIPALGADAVLCGDGEESLPRWLMEHARADGCHDPMSQETTQEKKGEFELLSDFRRYPYADDTLSLNRPGLLLSVISARGCPHRCAFCFEGGNSKTLRQRPVEEVLEEIEYRLSRSGHLRYLFFADDTFTCDIRRLEQFLDGLERIRETHDLVWFCEGHASFFRRHPDAMAKMVRAGMVRMQIGMESGNDRVLKMYGKHICADDIRYTAQLAWDANLPQLCGNFIIGGAQESAESLAQTKEFARGLLRDFPGLLDLSTTFPMPLPGTLLTREPERYGLSWTDPEFVTSLEDVPVNRTAFLGQEQICTARASFLHMVLSEMRELAAAGKIPEERIRRSLELSFRYGIVDSWCSYVYRRDEQLFAYYRAVVTSKLSEWTQVCGNLRPDQTVPVPVLPLRETSRDISEELIRILSLADGRSLKELQAEAGYDDGRFYELMQEAKEKHLLLFWEGQYETK